MEPKQTKILMLVLLGIVGLGAVSLVLIKNSITEGKAGQWNFGNVTVELVRENWVTGKGYEMRFMIKRR